MVVQECGEFQRYDIEQEILSTLPIWRISKINAQSDGDDFTTSGNVLEDGVTDMEPLGLMLWRGENASSGGGSASRTGQRVDEQMRHIIQSGVEDWVRSLPPIRPDVYQMSFLIIDDRLNSSSQRRGIQTTLVIARKHAQSARHHLPILRSSPPHLAANPEYGARTSSWRRSMRRSIHMLPRTCFDRH